jgi:hypothetical protein
MHGQTISNPVESQATASGGTVEAAPIRNVAVFRGGANRIKHSCNQPLVRMHNGRHSRFTHINSSNWQSLGSRLKLIHLKRLHPTLLDVNLRESLTKLGTEYGIDLSDYAVDLPRIISMAEQAKTFRYTISIGRKNCWADRLRYLLLSPQVGQLSRSLARTRARTRTHTHTHTHTSLSQMYRLLRSFFRVHTSFIARTHAHTRTTSRFPFRNLSRVLKFCYSGMTRASVLPTHVAVRFVGGASARGAAV